MPIRHLSLRRLNGVPAAVLAGVLSVVLAGCATGGAHLANVDALVAAYRDTVDFTGTLSVSHQQDGQLHNDTARYSWTQRPGSIDVTITGPLGQTVATIQVTPDAATLTKSDGVPHTAQDINALSAQMLGYALPVNGLRDWMQGYATDARGQRFAASPAHNEVVTDDGWHVRFAEWQDEAATPMPRRIRAERGATANNGELQINISITPAG